MSICYRQTLRGLLFLVAVASNASAQYLGKTTSTCGACTIPDNSCNSRPNSSQPCSATNVGSEEAWKTGSKVAVYIDSSAKGFPATAAQQSIETAFTNWQTAVGGAVTFTFTVVAGTPAPKGNYWLVTQGPAPSNGGNTSWISNSSGNVINATTFIGSSMATGSTSALEDLLTHEIAHPMGLGDENEAACKGISITYQAGNTLSQPSACDNSASKSLTCAGGTGKCALPPTGGGGGGGEGPQGCSTSQPNETCECEGAVWQCDCPGTAPTCSDSTTAICYNSGWTCGTVTAYCNPTGSPPYIPPDSGAEYVWDSSSCSWVLEPCSEAGCSSPIVIDTDGSGFHLTSAKNGVSFDFFGNGRPIQIAWTAPGSTNGWLALDRNGNGLIDNAGELFGNITAQPASSETNGYSALAVFDELDSGGNGDGIIDGRDAFWGKLLVWIDSNHDGISQPSELHHLDEIGIHSIGLMYVESRRNDIYGNKFRYKGSLNPDRGDKVDKVIYDVFLTNELK